MVREETNSCLFCLKSKDESELIEMSTNSIFLSEEEIIEFSDLITNLFSVKVFSEQSAFICEECKNLLVQFHIFKENVQNSSLLINKTNENIEKVRMFLEDNEDEEVYCIRYNKCLTLVPESKRSFMEIFKHWQPHVILDTINDCLPSPRKRMKRKSEEVEETHESIVTIQRLEENVEEELKSVDDMREEEWLQLEMASSSEVVETDVGVIESWVCRHCVPDERFFDGDGFRNHLFSVHLNCEHLEIEGDDDIDDQLELESEIDVNSQQGGSELPLQDSIVEQKVIEYMTKKPETIHLQGKKDSIDQKLFKSSRFEKLFCIECSYQFSSHAHYQAHINGHQIYEIVAKHSTFPMCELCNMMFCDDSHAAVHHNKHEHGAMVDEVIQCDGLFLKYGHHREDRDNYWDDPDNENALKCGHCLKKFTDEESCRLHQLIFHVKELKCPIESRVFNGNQAFNIHLKNNHPELFGDVKFACSVCKAEFSTLYEKLKHMKTCDKKKFQCNHCDKKFSQKCYLSTHLKQISGQASVTCEVCQKVCRDKGDYQIHFRSHSNIKPFKCSICPKAYKTSSARAAHLETHMEKGFDCLTCATKFKSRRTLQKHVKTKHAPCTVKVEMEHSGMIIIEEVVDTF